MNLEKPPLNQKHKKTMIKQNGNSPRDEDEGRTAWAAERRFEVVFKF
ncbi:hypothetical protein [Flavobacterium sp. I-STPP5a]|nr:hypothetical protein [Flavobacterium sp. I-STPP5a]